MKIDIDIGIAIGPHQVADDLPAALVIGQTVKNTGIDNRGILVLFNAINRVSVVLVALAYGHISYNNPFFPEVAVSQLDIRRVIILGIAVRIERLATKQRPEHMVVIVTKSEQIRDRQFTLVPVAITRFNLFGGQI